MTSSEIRQSFLDFFKSKQHTIVPSSSLMPDSPNLLFTNAGMNQFVPIFLGQQPCPYKPGRAADTQKCIRAGGKHNDLEDVGLDTYHHTFFEMLGNWSFGDYFKKEAIDWAWELVAEIWKFPKNRLYATVYNPDKSLNDPSEFDQEAWNYWAEKFRAAGLDPTVHIVNGNKKDNFWMMGETGPCGPCSEIHVDLTPMGDTKGALVNKGSAECIEIWNLVFIQFNANPDGSFTPLPAKHVDTGMGFERVTAIMQGTKAFSDFGGIISNYETDVFRPIFDKLEKMSGKKYTSTLPKSGSTGDTEQEKIDVAFRVIADHIRTLSFAIADDILPGNNERNHVLRSIHRRMQNYASKIGIEGDLLFNTQDALVETLVAKMGGVFSELPKKLEVIKRVLRQEAEGFSRTINDGLQIADKVFKRIDSLRDGSTEAIALIENLQSLIRTNPTAASDPNNPLVNRLVSLSIELSHLDYMKFFGNRPSSLQYPAKRLAQGAQDADIILTELREKANALTNESSRFPGRAAFLLSDTYGFPLDLTEVIARERGLKVDSAEYKKLFKEQQARSAASLTREIVGVASIVLGDATLSSTATVSELPPTKFIGYDQTSSSATVLQTARINNKTAVILNASPFYAEMGGQLGDTGEITGSGNLWRVTNTQKAGNAFLHFIDSADAPAVSSQVQLSVDQSRRNAIQRHHTVTHLFHWALHEIASKEALQKGSYVGPEKLTFDFNSAPLTPQQIRDIEKLVNERIVENGSVSWTEIPYSEAKNRSDITHLFGEKYGDRVRVVQIGGDREKLNGYSMELCGGTHTRSTGEIGLFRIVGESAIAAGVRRIEAIAGSLAYAQARQDADRLSTVADKLNTPLHELEKKVESVLAHQKELEKQLKAAQQREAAHTARSLVTRARAGAIPAIIENLGAADGDTLQNIADALKSQFHGAILLAGVSDGNVSLVAAVTPDFTSKVQAGKIIQAIAPIVGGKGGGRPESARGGGKDSSKINEALQKAAELISQAK